MQKIREFVKKFGSAAVALVFAIGIANSNSACLMVFHQPKEPDEMRKFKF